MGDPQNILQEVAGGDIQVKSSIVIEDKGVLNAVILKLNLELESHAKYCDIFCRPHHDVGLLPSEMKEI